MHLLQAGAAKSGNLWLYKIIEQIFKKAGVQKRSYVRRQAVYDLARTWPLSYPEQASIDMLEIRNRWCYWRISTIFRMPIEDLREYINQTSHVWTHSRICERSLQVYPLFDKVVYIMRDPRDRAVSEAKFAFSDYMQRFDPCRAPDFETYLEENLESMMNRWRWHVYDHLRYARELNIHVVFYERLLQEFQEELSRLLNYLELELNDREQEEIEQAVTFSSMKQKNPGHLRKGRSGDWDTSFTEGQAKRARQIIDPLADYLHYHDGCPRLPDELDQKLLQENLEEIGAEGQ